MKKIMFDDACSLTQAVKGGRKTNTRRQEKALDKEVQKHEETYKVPFSIVSQYYDFGKERLVIRTPKEVIYVKPRYKVGEVVAVAQSYNDSGWNPNTRQLTFVKEPTVFPDLDPISPLFGWIDLPLKYHKGWSNKMFVYAGLMPHQLRITNVRVERLQDISDEDCLNEGVFLGQFHTYSYVGRPRCPFNTPRDAFASLIDRISGKGTWKSNPWVFVYEFELVK